METLSSLGTFLGGVGFLLLGCGLVWWITLYDKYHKANQKKEK